MVWFKVDDSLPSAKDVLAIPRKFRCSAVGLWTMAGAWCSNQLTDGFVPEYLPEEFASDWESLTEWLVKATLWEAVEGGWRFVNWEKWNPSRESVMEKRAAEAERKASWREAKKAKKSPVPHVSQRDNSVRPNGTSASVPHVSQECPVLPVPDPTRPDPINTVVPAQPELHVVKATPRKRGTRLEHGWLPSQTSRDWARSKYAHLDLETVHEKFCNYWHAKSGRDATKVDWDATWRNWVINEAERIGNSRAAPNGQHKLRALATLIAEEETSLFDD